MSIKAIDTEYNGYKFRSRLEARWAVFFDQLQVPYQYELEGFDLDGVWYLPDFYLPHGLNLPGHEEAQDVWIEIKPTPELDDDERQKVAQFAKHTGYYLLLIAGDPGPDTVLRLITYDADGNWQAPHMRWTYTPTRGLGLAPVSRSGSAHQTQAGPKEEHPVVNAALRQARQERFERGMKRCESCGKRFTPYQDYYYLCPSCYRKQQQEDSGPLYAFSLRDLMNERSSLSGRKLFLAGGGIVGLFVLLIGVLAIRPSQQPAAAPTMAPTAIPVDTATATTSPTATATATAEPTAIPADCDCNDNNYNCSDFQTQQEAQTCFDFCYEESGDIHFLDEDGDQRACETLP